MGRSLQSDAPHPATIAARMPRVDAATLLAAVVCTVHGVTAFQVPLHYARTTELSRVGRSSFGCALRSRRLPRFSGHRLWAMQVEGPTKSRDSATAIAEFEEDDVVCAEGLC